MGNSCWKLRRGRAWAEPWPVEHDFTRDTTLETERPRHSSTPDEQTKGRTKRTKLYRFNRPYNCCLWPGVFGKGLRARSVSVHFSTLVYTNDMAILEETITRQYGRHNLSQIQLNRHLKPPGHVSSRQPRIFAPSINCTIMPLNSVLYSKYNPIATGYNLLYFSVLRTDIQRSVNLL